MCGEKERRGVRKGNQKKDVLYEEMGAIERGEEKALSLTYQRTQQTKDDRRVG